MVHSLQRLPKIPEEEKPTEPLCQGCGRNEHDGFAIHYPSLLRNVEPPLRQHSCNVLAHHKLPYRVDHPPRKGAHTLGLDKVTFNNKLALRHPFRKRHRIQQTLGRQKARKESYPNSSK